MYRFLGGVLSFSQKKRVALEGEGKLDNLVGRKPAKPFTVVGLSILASLVIVAWVLFIKYSL